MIYDRNLKYSSKSTTDFSGTDLNTTVDGEHTGIVFPFKKVDTANTPSFSSILKRGVNQFHLACSEYRLVTGDVESEEGITYTENPAVSAVLCQPKTFSKALNKLHEDINTEAYFITSNLTENILDSDKTSFKKHCDALTKVLAETISKKYQPMFFIDEENITKKVSTTSIPKISAFDKETTLFDPFITTQDKLSDEEIVRDCIEDIIFGYEDIFDVKMKLRLDRMQYLSLKQLEELYDDVEKAITLWEATHPDEVSIF